MNKRKRKISDEGKQQKARILEECRLDIVVYNRWRQSLVSSWTPERRNAMSIRAKRLWKNTEYREAVLAKKSKKIQQK